MEIFNLHCSCQTTGSLSRHEHFCPRGMMEWGSRNCNACSIWLGVSGQSLGPGWSQSCPVSFCGSWLRRKESPGVRTEALGEGAARLPYQTNDLWMHISSGRNDIAEGTSGRKVKFALGDVTTVQIWKVVLNSLQVSSGQPCSTGIGSGGHPSLSISLFLSLPRLGTVPRNNPLAWVLRMVCSHTG